MPFSALLSGIILIFLYSTATTLDKKEKMWYL